MGKKSRMKRIRRESQGENAGKMMNEIRKTSKLVAVEKQVGGKKVVQYFNPAKRLMQMKGYKDPKGLETLETMMSRYSSYMNANDVDLNKLNEGSEVITNEV